MLMMVDPNVHFHVIPRYAGSRSLGGIAFADSGWPGPPDLKSAVALDAPAIQRIATEVAGQWRSGQTNAG
jgi:diadenosine tetraphosphate (Ap4A) HIT family hydrolase